MNLRHITRFTYTFTNFQGWRVAIRRQGITLTRYFSDRQYDTPEAACEHAIRFRDMVLAELDAHPEEQAAEILKAHRPQPKKLYPAGLKPTLTPSSSTEDEAEHNTTACSVRSNKVMHNILKSVCRTLQLDTASVLKLSLYLFTLHYGQAAATPVNMRGNTPLYTQAPESPAPVLNSEENGECLHRIIQELESRGIPVGMPCFEEFATGKCRSASPEEPPPPVQTYAEPPPPAPVEQCASEATTHIPAPSAPKSTGNTSARHTPRRHVPYTPESCTTNHHSRTAQLAPQAFLPPAPRASLPSAALAGKSTRLFPGATPSTVSPTDPI